MKLALALGWQSVDMMLDNLSYKELQDWIEYYSIEPFPEERADFRLSYLMALLANINRDPKKHEAYEPSDFEIDFWKDSRVRNDKPKDFTHQIMLLNTALGGKVIKREDVK